MREYTHVELPALPRRHLERPHPSAAWTSLYSATCQSEDPSFPQNTAEAAEADAEGANPRQLAKRDSLAALLHMQVGAPSQQGEDKMADRRFPLNCKTGDTSF